MVRPDTTSDNSLSITYMTMGGVIMLVELLNGHKSLVGHTEEGPYLVTADDNGFAEVSGAVGDQLIALGSASAVSVDENTNDFDSMTVKDLRAYASSHEISLGSARSKEEIIAKLHEALSVDPEGENKGGDE